MAAAAGAQLVADLRLGGGDAGLGLGICSLGGNGGQVFGAGGTVAVLFGPQGRMEPVTSLAGWLVDVGQGGAQVVGEQSERFALGAAGHAVQAVLGVAAVE